MSPRLVRSNRKACVGFDIGENHRSRTSGEVVRHGPNRQRLGRASSAYWHLCDLSHLTVPQSRRKQLSGISIRGQRFEGSQPSSSILYHGGRRGGLANKSRPGPEREVVRDVCLSGGAFHGTICSKTKSLWFAHSRRVRDYDVRCPRFGAPRFL